MRTGYLNATKKFHIDSEIEQFNFSLTHTHLEVVIEWTIDEELAPVERANIYLENGILLKNIFIVNSSLLYYYESSWYYDYLDIRENSQVPKLNLLQRFNFSVNDILIVEADNTPKPVYSFAEKILRIITPFPPKPLDSKGSIERNIFVNELNWQKLPQENHDTIYKSRILR